MSIVKSQSVIRPRQEDYYDIIASLIFIFSLFPQHYNLMFFINT